MTQSLSTKIRINKYNVSTLETLQHYKERLETALDNWLPPNDQEPALLSKAIRYAALGPGKRIRPLLVYTTGEVFGVWPSELDGAACAVECIHAYSLIHDDLPAMDDDDLRRGRATCHKAFDEATAILAGDSLQVLAFQILSSDPNMTKDASRRLRMIELLAEASGPTGMAGGQSIDVQAAGTTPSVEELEYMHRCKTGALIRSSVLLGALAHEDITETQLAHLGRYADAVGLAFQIKDDILDVEGEAATLGKRPGADQARNKATYPGLLGMEEAKNRLQRLREIAAASLTEFGEAADPLHRLAHYIVDRSY